jgi:hypothetical protein
MAQQGGDDLIGQWRSSSTTAQCVIWKDKAGKFQYMEWDTSSGQLFRIISLRYEQEKLTVEEVFDETHYSVTSVYESTGENSLVSHVCGDDETDLIYERVK